MMVPVLDSLRSVKYRLPLFSGFSTLRIAKCLDWTRQNELLLLIFLLNILNVILTIDTTLSVACFNNSCQKPDKLRCATIHSFLEFRECFGWSVKKSGCPDGSYVVTVWLTPCKSRFVGLSLKDPPPSCKVATCCFSPCCIKFVSKLFESCIRVVSKLS